MNPRVLMILGAVCALLGALGAAAWLLLPRACPLQVIDHSPVHALVFASGTVGDAQVQSRLRARVAASQPGIYPALERALTGVDLDTRRRAVEALDVCDLPEALPMVRRLLVADDWVVRQAAVLHLTAFRAHHDVAPLLIAAADDREPEVRWAAVLLLGGMATPTALERVRVATADADPKVAIAAVSHLVRIGEPYPTAPLLAGLAHAHLEIRLAAVDVMGRSRDRAHVAHLSPMLGAAEALVRAHVARALGMIGGEPAIAAVVARLDDGDASVRSAAATILIQEKRMEAIPALVALADTHADARTRGAAADALSTLRARRGTSPAPQVP